jgi:hypothetical protein
MRARLDISGSAESKRKTSLEGSYRVIPALIKRGRA